MNNLVLLQEISAFGASHRFYHVPPVAEWPTSRI